ncbi:glycogen synthesis protein GlgS [Escherichia coli]
MDYSLNSLNNFDFLRGSSRMYCAEGRPVDILAVTGRMDQEHRTASSRTLCLYRQQMMQARAGS